jgi:hypothetical protein
MLLVQLLMLCSSMLPMVLTVVLLVMKLLLQHPQVACLPLQRRLRSSLQSCGAGWPAPGVPPAGGHAAAPAAAAVHGLLALLVQVCVSKMVPQLLPAGNCLLLALPGWWPSLAWMLLLPAKWSWYLPWAVLLVVDEQEYQLQKLVHVSWQLKPD